MAKNCVEMECNKIQVDMKQHPNCIFKEYTMVFSTLANSKKRGIK